MRILMLTQWFDPEPALKGLPFARALTSRGHEVQVLTGFPNYPGGRVYDGYAIKAFQREVIDGVRILRVPLYPSHDKSSLRRIGNYVSFALSATTIGSVLSKPADIMYVYHPPGTIGLPAMFLKMVRGLPFVYDIQDFWPDTLASTGMLDHPVALRLVDAFCRLVYREACKIAVLSPGFKEMLQNKGVPGEKIEVVYNWCDDQGIKRGSRNEDLARALGLADRFNVIFAGNMGMAQGLGAVTAAAAILEPRFPEIQFVLVGGGVEADSLKRRAEELRLRNVLFLARRPLNEIGEIINLADVLLVHLKDSPLSRATIPSKTQAYMAAGRPLLMGVLGDAADLVRNAGAGLSCQPGDPGSIAVAVERFFRMPEEEREAMGNSGRTFFERELSLDVGVSRFERLFTSCLSSSKSALKVD